MKLNNDIVDIYEIRRLCGAIIIQAIKDYHNIGRVFKCDNQSAERFLTNSDGALEDLCKVLEIPHAYIIERYKNKELVSSLYRLQKPEVHHDSR